MLLKDPVHGTLCWMLRYQREVILCQCRIGETKILTCKNRHPCVKSDSESSLPLGISHWLTLIFMSRLLMKHDFYYYYYIASVVSDSVRPHWRQPTRLPRPWDSPGKNTGVGCHFLLQCMKVKSESEVAQSGLTLRDPMDCSPPGSSIHGTFQARVLEWGATAFSEEDWSG